MVSRALSSAMCILGLFLTNAFAECEKAYVEVNGIVFEKKSTNKATNELVLIATTEDTAIVENCGVLMQVKEGDSVGYGVLKTVGLGYIELEINNESKKIDINW